MKNAIIFLLSQGSHRLRAITDVLAYCKYTSEIIIRIEVNEKARSVAPTNFKKLLSELGGADFERMLTENSEYEFSIDFDKGISERDFSQFAHLEHMFNIERKLRQWGVIKPVELYIQRKDGRRVSLMSASSGELSLISSLVFMLCHLHENNIILIDEPENSLHPQWQKEYVPFLLSLIGYHRVDIFIATHSPMIVSGAQVDHEDEVSFYSPKTGVYSRSSSSGVEATLWEQFNTISPESRYLSEQIVSRLDDLEAKKTTLPEVLSFIAQAQDASFDKKQESVFRAARTFANRIASGNDND